MSFGSVIKELKNQPETSNAGSRWSDEENEQLLEELKNNKSYEDIAKDHKRTITAIKAHIICYVIFPIYNINEIESNIDEISEKYNIEPEIISRYIKKTNKEDKKDVKDNKEITVNKRLENIEKILIKLNEQIDKITSLF